jgi:hypothetical protein
MSNKFTINTPIGENRDGAIRNFHLGDILSVTTGRLLSNRHMDGLYDIIGYIVNGKPYTLTLMILSEPCAEHIFKQHPQLREIDANVEFDGVESIERWLQTQIDNYGEYLEIKPMSVDGVNNKLTEFGLA